MGRWTDEWMEGQMVVEYMDKRLGGYKNLWMNKSIEDGWKIDAWVGYNGYQLCGLLQGKQDEFHASLKDWTQSCHYI